jgi:hypothetical protein
LASGAQAIGYTVGIPQQKWGKIDKDFAVIAGDDVGELIGPFEEELADSEQFLGALPIGTRSPSRLSQT